MKIFDIPEVTRHSLHQYVFSLVTKSDPIFGTVMFSKCTLTCVIYKKKKQLKTCDLEYQTLRNETNFFSVSG